MASPVVIPSPPDWPGHVRTSSFIGWDRAQDRPVTPELDEFLDAAKPPALITLGASGAIAADDFLESATDAVVGTGTRALVVSGPRPMPTTRYDRDIVHVTDYAPFSEVAARCRIGIHHAGIGTAVALMRAGIPHLAVPRAFDQPVTAAIIDQLGIGAALPWRRRRQLGKAVQAVLQNDDYAVAARRLADDLADDIDGATQTANVIEELVTTAHHDAHREPRHPTRPSPH